MFILFLLLVDKYLFKENDKFGFTQVSHKDLLIVLYFS